MANVQRMGMTPGAGTPPGARPAAASQPTIVLARPGQQMTMSGAAGGIRAFQGRPGQMLSGVRVGAGGPRIPVQVPTVAGGGGLVINNPGLAPGRPGSQITVPLQALQGLQPGQGIPTGQAGHLLVRTENNQYQIMGVGSSASSSVPSSVTTVRRPAPTMRTTMAPVSAPSMSRPGPMNTVAASVGAAAKTTTAPSGSGGSGGMGGQMTPDTAKHKCKNFLATLLRLAGEQPANVAQNVRNLIRGLIDGKVEPETFASRLQQELNSSPQPCLVPFLKKSLPYLQSSLQSGELTIDGVRAPPRVIAGPQQVRPGIRGPSNVIYPPQSGLRTPTPQVRQRTAFMPQPAGTPRTPISVAHLNKPMPMTGTSTTKITSSPASIRPPMGKSQQIIATKSLAPNRSTTTIHKIGAPQINMPMGMQTGPTGIPMKSNSFNNIGGTTISKKPSMSYSSATPDDDVNDVASMAGINLDDEAKRMAATDMMTIRSCKDETFLQTGLLHERISRICRTRGLDEPPIEVIQLVSHATQERLKTLLEKLAVIAEHRLDVVRAADEGDRYEVTQDVRGQLKFLSELDKMERKRHDEAEREILYRAAKSRTKTEDPEEEKLKLKAKELQRFEEEQLKHEKANSTARLAIGGGPRKKLKIDEPFGITPKPSLVNRPRIKRVHLRDLLFLMEQEKETKRSPLLWKAFSS